MEYMKETSYKEVEKPDKKTSCISPDIYTKNHLPSGTLSKENQL